MIITVTLNPALDVSCMVSELIPNEKAYAFNEVRLAGGNGINAARIAHRLGAEVRATGFLGGSSGNELAGILKLEKIKHTFIPILGMTRTNVTISQEITHQQTRLSFPGPKIISKELKALYDLILRLKPSLIVIGGSLPPGVSKIFINKLIRYYNKQGVPTLVDVPGKVLKQILNSRPYFIKPNLTEYCELTGLKLTRMQDVLGVARKLSASIPLQCISSVEGGALLVTPQHAWFGKTPELKVQSTVGAGDSMVGAIAHSLVNSKCLLNEHNCEKLLRLGLASACATLSSEGLTMGTRASIMRFVPEITIRKVD
ncbi:MAG TPA: 1-phosphofructokinase family hexose kinase [Bacteriovoracaceae bacterium]|nr:1-phosphofructokinase family hexose kinase [Bacteriovoracaceae bacterium]